MQTKENSHLNHKKLDEEEAQSWNEQQMEAMVSFLYTNLDNESIIITLLVVKHVK